MAGKTQGHGDGVVSITAQNGVVTYYARVQYQGRQHSVACGNSLKRARQRAAAMRQERDECVAKGIVWTTPREKSRRERQKKQGEFRPPTLTVPTIAQFSQRFLDDWVGVKASFRYYATRIKVINAALGITRLDALTLADVQRFYTQRVRLQSVATANHDVRVLSVMLNRAVEWDIITKNVADRLKRERAAESGERFLYREELEKLLRLTSDADFKALILGATHTGMRQGEQKSLTWGQVDLPARVITLAGRDTKGKRGRQIEINETLAAVLSAMVRPFDPKALVFTREGRPWSPTMIKKAWSHACDRSGLTDARWHDLRHTFASWAMMGGTPLERLQQALGHRDIRLTQRYAKFAPGAVRGVCTTLDTYAGPSRTEAVGQAVS